MAKKESSAKAVRDIQRKTRRRPSRSRWIAQGGVNSHRHACEEFVRDRSWTLGERPLTRRWCMNRRLEAIKRPALGHTGDGPLSLAVDNMVWNITKDEVTERMAVSPDQAWR